MDRFNIVCLLLKKIEMIIIVKNVHLISVMKDLDPFL